MLQLLVLERINFYLESYNLYNFDFFNMESFKEFVYFRKTTNGRIRFV